VNRCDDDRLTNLLGPLYDSSPGHIPVSDEVDMAADGVVGRIEEAGLPPIEDIRRSHDFGLPFFISPDVSSSPPLDCNSCRPKGELCLEVVDVVLVVDNCSDSWKVLRRKRAAGRPCRL
jgi:hypothetical protein